MAESSSSLPLNVVSDVVRGRLEQFGAPPEISSSEFYRTLANHDDILLGWVEFSWRLRMSAGTPRRLRELVICRTVQLLNCEYELRPHEQFALENGVKAAELQALPEWRESEFFTEDERAALDLADAMYRHDPVPGAVVERLREYFDPEEVLELIVTTGFYNAVPRIISALGLTSDNVAD